MPRVVYSYIVAAVFFAVALNCSNERERDLGGEKSLFLDGEKIIYISRYDAILSSKKRIRGYGTR